MGGLSGSVSSLARAAQTGQHTDRLCSGFKQTMEADESRRALGAQGERRHPPWSSFNRDLSRLLALSDGIFAFAMTLLVLGLVVPAGFGSKSDVVAFLQGLWPDFLAYLLGFLVIYLYWRQHGQVFRYVVSFDWTISNLNVLFLLFVAMMPFLTILLAAAGQSVFVVWLYAGIQVSAGLTLLVLWKYATGSNRHVDSTLPRSWVAFVSRSGLIAPMLFAASAPLALWNPYASEVAWFGILPIISLYRFHARREFGLETNPHGLKSSRPSDR